VAELFWLTDEQFAKLAPLLPTDARTGSNRLMLLDGQALGRPAQASTRSPREPSGCRDL